MKAVPEDHVPKLLKVALVIIYRLTLHPLAKYPGPLLGRLTDWYSVWYRWSGNHHINFYQIHQKYGKSEGTLAYR